MKISTKGVITKIRVIQNLPTLLVRFTILDENKTFNCIVADKDIVNRILMLPDNVQRTTIFGHMNKRNQLVVEKLAFQGTISYFKKGA